MNKHVVNVWSALIARASQDLSDFPNKCGAALRRERLDTWQGLAELRRAGKIRAPGTWKTRNFPQFCAFFQFLNADVKQKQFVKQIRARDKDTIVFTLSSQRDQ